MVDFGHRIEGLDPLVVAKYQGRMDEAPGIFALMRSMPGAIHARSTTRPPSAQNSATNAEAADHP